MKESCVFGLIWVVLTTNGWLVSSAALGIEPTEWNLEPFAIEEAWALQFDAEMGRDSTSGTNVKKREVSKADFEMAPENDMEGIPLLSEESLLTRRSRSDIYIGPARPNLREFHNW